MLMDSVEFKNSEVGEPEEAEYPDAPIEAGVFIIKRDISNRHSSTHFGKS